jgi:hypothetical protein
MKGLEEIILTLLRDRHSVQNQRHPVLLLTFVRVVLVRLSLRAHIQLRVPRFVQLLLDFADLLALRTISRPTGAH